MSVAFGDRLRSALGGHTERVSLDAIRIDGSVRPVSEEGVEKIINGMELTGEIQYPLLVDENYVLIDGAHRLEAARRQGLDDIEVKVLAGAVGREIRQVLGVVMNTARTSMSPLELVAVYPMIRDAVKADRAAARQATQLAGRDSFGSAKFAEPKGTEVTSLPVAIADDGRSRSTLREVLGVEPVVVERCIELQGWAADEGLPGFVRTSAADGLKTIEREPGAVSRIHRQVKGLLDARPAPLTSAEVVLDDARKRKEMVMLPLVKAWRIAVKADPVQFARDLVDGDIMILGNAVKELGRFVNEVSAARADVTGDSHVGSEDPRRHVDRS